MLKTIFIVVVLLIATVLIYAATKPNMFRVQRTASINASPDEVFGLINDFHTWASWSPWEKKDLAMKKIHSGAPQGKGAVLEWDGNKDVGTGRMEVLESVPTSTIRIKLDFLKPFEAYNQAAFTLTPNAGSTQVTWTMHGPQPFMMKVMDIVMNMDKMVGKDFEEGLANLKALAEK
jgi:uncharacterized protein YndB with AHSA1/START domain